LQCKDSGDSEQVLAKDGKRHRNGLALSTPQENNVKINVGVKGA